MLKLKPEVKETWFALMDEMKDRQTRGRMKEIKNGDSEDCYCAIGLLGLACQRVTGQGEFIDRGSAFSLDGSGGNGWVPIAIGNGVCPLLFSDGWDSKTARLFFSDLVIMNDSERLTFAQIKEKMKDTV